MMRNLSIQIETSFSSIEKLRDEWDQFVIDVGSDLYMSFDYCRIWWEVYGFKRKLRIFLFRNEDQFVAILPILIDRIQLGPVGARVARLVGSDIHREIIIPPVRPAQAEEVFSQLLKVLFEEERCHALVWGCYSGLSDTSDFLRKAVAHHPDQVHLEKDVTMQFPHANFFLPATGDEYLRSLKRARRQSIRRFLDRIRERGSLELTVIRDAETAVKDFPGFRNLYDSFNKSKGRPGHFLGDRLRERFWLKLCDELGERGGVRFYHLSLDQVTMAFEYCLKFGKTYHWKYRVRSFGQDWDNLGIGSVGTVELMKSAIEEGVSRVEAGPGHFEYKVGYGATESPIGSILLITNRPSARFRFRLFVRLIELLDLVYLKIWFFHLRPRLPLPPRPRWNLWLRTRI